LDLDKEIMRNILCFKNYYLDFFKNLKPEVKKKFNWTLQLIAVIEHVSEKHFKHIKNSPGLFEIRVEIGSNIYRVFSFFEEGNLIIQVNGFQKKTQKTPKEEIQLAEKLKKTILR
jgi:phage-related protein